jgi:CheY-like chemotaxis protein
LLVEDHPINQKLAVALLERWGHRVTVADNGRVALEMLQTQSFDLVLMDMMMPVMDGIETTQRIRSAEQPGAHLPIVAMTANAMQSDRERCLNAGMDDFIAKPIALPELQRVLSVLGQSPHASQLLPRSAIQPAEECALVMVRSEVEFDYAAALAACDQEVVDIVAEVFMAQWPLDLEKMTQAVRVGDGLTLLQVAHTIKGTIGLFGATPPMKTAQVLETMVAENALLPGSLNMEVMAMLTALQHQVEQVLLILRHRYKAL